MHTFPLSVARYLALLALPLADAMYLAWHALPLADAAYLARLALTDAFVLPGLLIS
ncbi:hypothetical protein J7438_00275 [Thalassotalea sp. G20_0]|nr:hypothetical protein [Thalassotalea sp. G20_0]